MSASSQGGGNSLQITDDAIKYIINHVFHPPRLPQQSDCDWGHESALLRLITKSLVQWKEHVPDDQHSTLDAVAHSVECMASVHVTDPATGQCHVSESELQRLLCALPMTGGTIPVYVAEQNAAILISFHDDSIDFEPFELSPSNDHVTQAKGRLRRTFPASVVSLSTATFEEAGFQTTLARTLCKLSSQRAADTKPKAKKAKLMHEEVRDTTHPKLVTELCMSMLASMSSASKIKSSIRKNTREEVLWADCMLPWRRSPIWLLLRVTMQLLTSRAHVDASSPDAQYKGFMVWLMSKILGLSLERHISNELIFVMNAKIARRLLKLRPSKATSWLETVSKISQDAQDCLKATWNHVQGRANPELNLKYLKNLDGGKDSAHSLPGLEEYLQTVHYRHSAATSVSFQPASVLNPYKSDQLPRLNLKSLSDDISYQLKDFEAWVAHCLNDWLGIHLSDQDTCQGLGDLIYEYHRSATGHYEHNPEALSIMTLTILELWTACDKSASSICSLLTDYDPGLPDGLLESLILSTQQQMTRLFKVEAHLAARRKSRWSADYIFGRFGSNESFAVRYFHQSPRHQHRLQQIESKAERKKEAKLSEFRQSKQKYADLMHNFNQQSGCDYYEVHDRRGRQISKHSHDCSKCSFLSQAQNVMINIYEWPLSNYGQEAQATAFELKVPAWFGHWRDATAFVLVDLLQGEYELPSPPSHQYQLSADLALAKYFVQFRPRQHIGVVSEVKSHTVTHRNARSVASLTEVEVCPDNALRYRYFDTRKNCFTDRLKFEDRFSSSCTFQLLEEYATLQRFMFRTTENVEQRTPNQVIARISECPASLTPEEFHSLGTLPWSFCNQWADLLIRFLTPTIDFRKTETTLLVSQVIYQTGPKSSNAHRQGHELLKDDRLCDQLLKSLEEALNRCRANWDSYLALGIFCAVARRILSLSATDLIKTRCMRYLSDIRDITCAWIRLLKGKASDSHEPDERTEFTSQAVSVALVCLDTFNMEREHLSQVLGDSENMFTFFQCSISVQEGHLAASKSFKGTGPVRFLLQRWKCLSYRALGMLREATLRNNSCGLDNAIRNLWPSFQRQGSWSTVNECGLEYWVVCHTASSAMHRSLDVHFDLLRGELLVNGAPLARLPTKYAAHSVYEMLFGSTIIEVMPSELPGLLFTGKYGGKILHFNRVKRSINGVACPSDLIIQEIRDDVVWDLIPSRCFNGHLPRDFVNNFAHWYNVSDQSVEFRPRNDPWTSSSKHWMLRRVDATSWQLKSLNTCLISIGSRSAKILSKILRPLGQLSYMHISFCPSTSSFEIKLPSLALVFSLESGTRHIRSREFRGMLIDEDQALQALVGLENKLMLRNEESSSRLAIVPASKVDFSIAGDHVRVIIDTTTATKAYAYRVDHQLGQLLAKGLLRSQLFLCYLHAITSFCLPDPLTSRTGTEQALEILESAAVRSRDELEQEDVDILTLIRQLSPQRRYYPSHLRCMQSISWSNKLGFLAQHDQLYTAAEILLSQYKRTSFFLTEDTVKIPKLQQNDGHLLSRGCIRAATFRGPGHGAVARGVEFDTEYVSRDQITDQTRFKESFSISSKIFNKEPSVDSRVMSDFASHIWTFCQRYGKVYGPGYEMGLSPMYDGEFLEDPKKLIANNWCSIHCFLSKEAQQLDRFDIMAWLSTLAFNKNFDSMIVRVLASFFTVPRMASITPPLVEESFDLLQGSDFRRAEIQGIVQEHLKPISASPEAAIPRKSGESDRAYNQRKNLLFDTHQNTAMVNFLSALQNQWPVKGPRTPRDDVFGRYLNVSRIMPKVSSKFERWYENHQFRQYLTQVAEVIGQQGFWALDVPCIRQFQWTRTTPRYREFFTLDDIFSILPPQLPEPEVDVTNGFLLSSQGRGTGTALPIMLVDLMTEADHEYQKRYVGALCNSWKALKTSSKDTWLLSPDQGLQTALQDHLRGCIRQTTEIYEIIVKQIEAFKDQVPIHRSSVQWPVLSPVMILGQLSRERWAKLSPGWRQCVVSYAMAVVELQRAKRMVAVSNNSADLIKELANRGHSNWDPMEHPESLLLEVESGIMIRDVQEQIAKEMRAPPTGRNTVMQLNMGEGKSSVIVPMVATALADGKHLVRIVVGKPQSQQMFETLIETLGGLINRRIYRLPFSRSLKINHAEATIINGIVKDCMTQGGVLLVQAEHILSLQLMGVESLISGDADIGRSILSTQQFIDDHGREIIDESDENLSVKFELTYTIGLQRPVEHSPNRWVCIQGVLGIVRSVLQDQIGDFPDAVDLTEGAAGSFPRFRFVDPQFQQLVLDAAARRICEKGIPGLSIAFQSPEVQQAVYQYITDPEASAAQLPQPFESKFRENLLLLKGLFAGGILVFAFSRQRWRVTYGLNPERLPKTKLVLPFRAKDMPSPRAEFSHTDVILLLTCLCHYYGGLLDEDLFLTLQHLLNTDQADLEYHDWIQDAPGLPASFRNLSGVNIKDRVQCKREIFPHFRFAKSVVDYFLSRIVFPREVREFPHKLSASGWDIARLKTHPVTGFSGTNDSQILLPLSMEHRDLERQRHTNALVLEHLLRPENTAISLPPKSHLSDAEQLLQLVTRSTSAIRVILDVGAQILEMTNFEVARCWLAQVTDLEETKAVVFFDEKDQICVLDRQGTVELLRTSPFAEQLDLCLIFLDEAHTRGTDLRLPRGYRAAVTLGPGVTKDRLVQACMRMRQLGQGHSVVLCVPEEVKRKIMAQIPEVTDECLNVSHVLRWTIFETWSDLSRKIRLWANQGMRFEKQQMLWAKFGLENLSLLSQEQARKFLEDEAQSLKQRYAAEIDLNAPTNNQETSIDDTDASSSDQEMSGSDTRMIDPVDEAPQSDVRITATERTRVPNFDRIAQRCRDMQTEGQTLRVLEEEQERELAPEVEQQRQIERPPPVDAYQHMLYSDVKRFASTGIMVRTSTAFMPAFRVLGDTSASAHCSTSSFPSGLLATKDFAFTVEKRQPTDSTDLYQRPVQHVLSSTCGTDTIKYLVCISPFEADLLFPIIMQKKKTSLHYYSPRVNLGFRTLDHLDVYTIPTPIAELTLPTELVVQLNLFAGQLFFSDYEQYTQACGILGLPWEANGDNEGDDAAVATLETSRPTKFIEVLMTKIRRQCDQIDKTHVGRILDGQILEMAELNAPTDLSENPADQTEEELDGNALEDGDADVKQEEVQVETVEIKQESDSDSDSDESSLSSVPSYI